jgi:hypothetical protein
MLLRQFRTERPQLFFTLIGVDHSCRIWCRDSLPRSFQRVSPSPPCSASLPA